tara:strand:- start:1695 stop:1940 length:246 start_codon:yes stop_codon:yes gene_type:complete
MLSEYLKVAKEFIIGVVVWFLLVVLMLCYLTTVGTAISYVFNSYNMEGYVDTSFGLAVFFVVIGTVWIPYHIKSIFKFMFK